MEYIYIDKEDDKSIIADYKKRFETKSLEELVKIYNKEAKSGIVGVHRQALYLIALRQEFRERLKESPIYLLEHVLGLAGPIKVVNGHVKILDVL